MKALALAQENGAAYVGSFKKGMLGDKKIYSSTIIRPEDTLGGEMKLSDRAALAFFSWSKKGTELLHIDTVPSAGFELNTMQLQNILRRF